MDEWMDGWLDDGRLYKQNQRLHTHTQYVVKTLHSMANKIYIEILK